MKLTFRGKRRAMYIPFFNDTFKSLFSQVFQAYLGTLNIYTVAGRFFLCFLSVSHIRDFFHKYTARAVYVAIIVCRSDSSRLIIKEKRVST